MVKVILAALLPLILVGCATVNTGNFCDVASPRRPSKEQIAVMKPEQRKQDLAFNKYGAEKCGWRP